MTVNGVLNDRNCSNWNEKVCADLSQIFHDKCNVVSITETKNGTLAGVVTNELCNGLNAAYLGKLSIEEVINHTNCSRDRVVQVFQDCMIEKLYSSVHKL